MFIRSTWLVVEWFSLNVMACVFLTESFRCYFMLQFPWVWNLHYCCYLPQNRNLCGWFIFNWYVYCSNFTLFKNTWQITIFILQWHRTTRRIVFFVRRKNTTRWTQSCQIDISSSIHTTLWCNKVCPLFWFDISTLVISVCNRYKQKEYSVLTIKLLFIAFYVQSVNLSSRLYKPVSVSRVVSLLFCQMFFFHYFQLSVNIF